MTPLPSALSRVKAALEFAEKNGAHYVGLVPDIRALIEAVDAMTAIEAAASAIFENRKGAFGTALIERGKVALSMDLENLRKALAACAIDRALTQTHKDDGQ